jgi:hypothetical protein
MTSQLAPVSPHPNDRKAIEYNLTRNIADRAWRLLKSQLKPHPSASLTTPLFYAWPRHDRAILIFDPTSFKNPRTLLDSRFAERLAAGMGNRKVVVTLHGALFVQVSYTPLSFGQLNLGVRPLDFSQQPGPSHIPLGTTKKGALWLSLLDMDSILVGGARRMGKTRILHGFIQALVRGGQAELVLWDGKNGVEFGRYAGMPGVTAVRETKLVEALTNLSCEMIRRQELFQQVRVTNLSEYNTRAEEKLPVLVPVIDELTLIPDEIQSVLAKIIALGGAFGIHPILATQRPDAENVQGLLKTNLSTRIALPVPDHQASKIILGRTGAEKLPKIKGRMLLIWEAKVLEVQAFQIDLPQTDPASSSRENELTLLTPREQVLVQTAVQEMAGWFKIRELAEKTGQGRDFINHLARQWESLGYLTPIQRNQHGHPLGRQVTKKLLLVAGFSGSTDQEDQPDQDFLSTDRGDFAPDQGRIAASVNIGCP